MEDIPQRLVLLETQFYSAISEDDDALHLFAQSFSTLLDDVKEASRLRLLDDETVIKAHTLACQIQILGSHFLKAEKISFDAKVELDEILCSAPATETSPGIGSCPPSRKTSSSKKRVAKTSLPEGGSIDALPSYIAPAYQWLLKNLHDPYPSREIKLSISRTASSSLTHINAWFMNVRRRIGWTAISRKHFSNCRSDTVDAAYRALVAEDPDRPLESHIILDFVALKVAAEGLYSEKFSKSSLAGELNTNDNVHENARDQKLVASSYPSPPPECSAPSSPTSSHLTLEDQGRESTLHVLAGRKRRASLSTSGSEIDVLDTPQARPTKRICSDGMSLKIPVEPSIVYPPSPQSPPRESESQMLLPVQPSHQSNVTSLQTHTLPQRKRRLSDSDSYPSSKRPRGLDVDPRPQAVSDSFPPLSSIASNELTVDGWFHPDFEIPDPVAAEEPDPSTFLHFDIFQDWNALYGITTEASTSFDYSAVAQPLEPGGSEPQALMTENFGMPSLPSSYGDNVHDVQEMVEPISLRPVGQGFTDQWLIQYDSDKVTTSDPSNVAAVASVNSNDVGFFDSPESEDSAWQSIPRQPPLSWINSNPVELTGNASSVPLSIDGTSASWTPISANSASVPSNSCSRFFDDLMSQGHSDTDLSHPPSLVPSPVAILEKQRLAAEKQTKLEALRKHQEEARLHQEAVRRLEAELSLS